MDESSKGAVSPQQMDELRKAVERGSVGDLYSLISTDEDILDKIDKKPFVETPLHMAADKGQTKFAMEVLRLKRSFSKKLNKEGYTPMHLALQNPQIEIVRCLLHFDETLVRVHGRDGLTPLHHVAKKGNLDLLAKFLRECPRSIEDVTNERETVLHVALKNEKLEAFQLLLGWLRRTWFKQAYLWEKKLLNAEDEKGDTVLDIAVAKNLAEIVKSLLKFNSHIGHVIDLKSKNPNYLKTLKVLQRLPTNEGRGRIKNMLHLARRFCTSQGASDLNLASYFKSPVTWEEKIHIFFLRQTANISNDSRNALLVVAVLLLTITYQATVSPAGGVWQDNFNISATRKFQHKIHAGYNSGYYVRSPHSVGTATMEANIFILLSVLNCLSFFVSIFSLLILLPGDFRSGLVGLPLYVLTLCFLAALFITTPINVFPFHMPSNHYILFCILSTLLFLAFECIVLYRRRALVKNFIPIVKELDPNLHVSET